MAQRVVIAMALVAQPQILLADDATLGLDATVQVQVLDMMVDRCRKTWPLRDLDHPTTWGWLRTTCESRSHHA